MQCRIFYHSKLISWLTLWMFMALAQVPAFAQQEYSSPDTITFVVKTYDGLELPAQVLKSKKPAARMILFLNGSTPYDEKGNQWGAWDENGKLLESRHDFYVRFFDVMSGKGYDIATLAKRSFVYSHNLPRPNLDEYALDIQSFVMELQKREILGDIGKLVIVGYSEGSLVATKVLGLLKNQPFACILLGSGSCAFDYENQTWEEWFMTDVYRRLKGISDEELKKEFDEWRTMMNKIPTIDEDTWENQWKKQGGPAPWESYYVDRELRYYDPAPNLLEANIPVLICIGENDTAMPMVLARRTYDSLLKSGFQKASFRMIEGETHQYEKYDVFAIIDTWLSSDGKSTDFVLAPEDSTKLGKISALDEIKNSISELSWEGGQPEKALECSAKPVKVIYSYRISGLYLESNCSPTANTTRRFTLFPGPRIRTSPPALRRWSGWAT